MQKSASVLPNPLIRKEDLIAGEAIIYPNIYI